MTILYLSLNGVTDHIGRSQIAPYVLGLAARGYRMHLLSAEKAGRDKLIADYQRCFDRAGVKWTRVRYRNTPPLISTLGVLGGMYLEARRIVKCEAVRVVHCRSHLPATLGRLLKKSQGTKYIFDFRDFWADGGLQTKRFKFVYRYFKRKEQDLVRDADHVVCLTAPARNLLADRYLADRPEAASAFGVVPCCADFDLFNLANVSEIDRAKARHRAGLQSESCVLLYVGSLGADYLLDEMYKLFRQLLAIRSDAVFLFVANNGQELIERARIERGIPARNVRFVTADRAEVPVFISLADLSVMFIRPGSSKIGCSPTKLAELFACNVPIIANSGVGDLDSILALDRNNSVAVRDFSEETLRKALLDVLHARETSKVDIRANSREFRLETGVGLYAKVYEGLLRDGSGVKS